MSTTFDPTTFMGTVIEGAMNTKYFRAPEGDYPASLGSEEKDFKIRVNKDGTVVLDCFWYIEDPALQEAAGGAKQCRVRHGLFLNLGPDGRLTPDNNQALALLREALGQNQEGKAWTPSQLRGAGPAMITVKHRDNPDDPENPYCEVAKVNTMKRRRSAA